VAELIQKDIAMAEAAPKGRVAGLVDIVDESESLCYLMTTPLDQKKVQMYHCRSPNVKL
jgi:hypothetical protein